MRTLAEEGSRIAGALQAAETIVDPIERYRALTLVQEDVDRLVSAIKLARGAALDEVPGTLAEVAELAGLGSYQKVQKLITAARAAQRLERGDTMAKSKDSATTRSGGSCPHSNNEICGPCAHAMEVRESISRDRLTPLEG